MKDYKVLKSSREVLIRMAGFKEGHHLFNTDSRNQIHENLAEDDRRDADSPGEYR
jgi:hypothetical protein